MFFANYAVHSRGMRSFGALSCLWALSGVVAGRRAVQADHVSLEVREAEQHCCCVNGICPDKYRAGSEEVAVYNPNADLCCRLNDRSCGHVLNSFSRFQKTAEKSFCQADGREPSFVAPSLPQASVPTTPPQPGQAAHTVHTYCDLGLQRDVDNEETDSAATSLRRNIVQTMVNEVSRNSIDAMAKEIFSIYVCTRWAPTGDFTRVMEAEVSTGQLPKSEPSTLYKERRFLPLRCSSNFKVFEEVGLGQTSFQAFEAQMEALANWYQGEKDGAVAHRLESLEGDLEDAKLFDLQYVKSQAAACPESTGPWNVSVHTAPAAELLSHCPSAKWWLSKLENWHHAMPFTSFMSPDVDAAKFAPKGQEQILMCFGKRVASQLHRREGGSHLLTDQNAIGCHGFWDLGTAGRMLERIVKLWRPPTCQLASMELAMKLKIMELIANMNERLFDALPALLTEEIAPDDDWDGKELRAASLGGSLLHGMWDSIAKSFSALSGQYTRLGQLLGSSVVKWVVCPIKNTTGAEDLDRLDAALGTEDDTARYYAQIAYSKWTGKKDLLPGEECTPGVADLPRTTACSLAIMQQDMPEPYKDSEFICPVRPLLPAKQQLEILKKKSGLCPLRMNTWQMEQAGWFYRGRRPQRQQYDLVENAPASDIQAVQILDMISRQDTTFHTWRTFVTVGLGCTEEEARQTPRWCADPEVHYPQASVNGMVDAVGRAGRGTAQMVSQALHAAGVTEEAPVVNQAVGHRLSEWLYHQGKGVQAWAKQTTNEWFGQASSRYDKLHKRSFTVQEANELVHSLSFQKLLEATGADSKNKQRYDRYAVVTPCKTMNAETEFELKYATAETALQLARKAFRKYGVGIGHSGGFTVELTGLAMLKMSGVQAAWVESHALVRAYSLGSSTPDWLTTNNPMMQSLAGTLAARTAEGVRASDLTGFRAFFACGNRKAMHDLPLEVTGPEALPGKVFKDCVVQGKTSNSNLRKENPGAPYLESEVVVRVTLASLPACFLEVDRSKAAAQNETRNPVYQTFESISGCPEMPSAGWSGLPEPVQNEVGTDQFRGLLAGKGLPGKVLYEVLLDPEDFILEAHVALHGLAKSLIRPFSEEAVPLYLWVQEHTKHRFLEMCAEENVTISEMLTRWASTRSAARTLTPASGASAESSLGGVQPERREEPERGTSSPLGAESAERLQSPPAASVARSQAALEGNFLLRLGEDDLKLLRRKAKKHSPLIATWTTGEAKYMSLAMNLALSIRKNVPSLERSFVCVALDRAARRAMRKSKFHTLSHPVLPGPSLKDAIWKMRWLVLHTFAHLGIDGLVLDSDIVVLQDPFPVLWGDADFEVMTDHFWPEQHLWQYWTRPEEHINTGCIFVKASVRTKAFLYEFLEHHNESEVGGLLRHWMDQQVFNKFVEHRLFHSSADLIHGLYGHQVFRNVRAQKIATPIRLRILDPKVVSHGMNYFWLRAHEGGRPAVIAHANGVDGKEYFLRDRGHWYLDDFDERFPEQGFLTYAHPRGMSLAEDFEHLVEAVVVAAALRRRLVLPNTMNCKNCPALEAYGAPNVLEDGNCTFDYFAWSQSFLGHHGELVAESGLRLEARFRSLPESRYARSQFTKALGGRDEHFLKIEAARRLHVLDIRAAFQDVQRAGFGPAAVFECRHHDWPVGWMACRDQRFVRYHGQFSKCKPGEAQTGCGYRGITCCDAFWGWGEKLEYFTGKPWNLPCNCGLSGCQEQTGASGSDRNSKACCAHVSGGPPRCDRRIRPESVPDVNTPEDTESLTSTALADLASPSRNVTAFWHTCRLNRQLRFSDTSVDELVFACHRLATRFLLLKQNFDALGAWCRFAHGELRRGVEGSSSSLFPASWPSASALPVRDAEMGELEQLSDQHMPRKLSHDLAQLQFLGDQFSRTAKELQTLGPEWPAGRYVGNRAHFVPKLRLAEEVFGAGMLDAVEDTGQGVVMVDRVLQPEAAERIWRWMAQATIWHAPKWDGSVLEASLLDGLNCEALLSLVQALCSLKLVQSMAGRHGAQLVVDDMWAWKYDPALNSVSVPIEAGSWSGDPPDLLAALSLSREPGPDDGIRLERGTEKRFLPRRQNQLVLWTRAWKGGASLSMDKDVRYEHRPVDLFVAFRKSLGHKVYPGWTAHMSTRWPASTDLG
ncbi:rskn-1 [Symbiodinium natans]|uniref:Rskn-1 protein n=1 Tax=Symbiodinium natans TaxID=878477 RepID=A0A812JC60_9DINO|nr:rskn-1 [Symbiodinium natans]